MGMKVTLEDAGPCRKIMQVTVPGEEIAPDFEAVTKEFTKASRVHGFRPGKAPRAIVERHYAANIRDEVQKRVVPRVYREAIKGQSLTPVAIVKVGDVVLKREEGVRFSVTIDVPPEFKLPRYKNLALKADKTEITDVHVDDALNQLLDRMSRFEEVTGVAVKSEHLVQVDYRGECDGKPVTELAPKDAGVGEGKDFLMLVGGQELLPGFSAGLTGAAVGETRQIKVAFPEQFRLPELAGKEALYTVTVKRIRERKRPTLDADLLKKLEVESEAVLRERLRNDLTRQAEAVAKANTRAEVERLLLAEAGFDVPATVVQEETDLTLRNMIRRIVTDGASREQIQQNRSAIVGEAQRVSKDNVKMAYILSRIADEEKIAVQDSEMEERLSLMAQSHDMPVERLRAELEKRNGMQGLKSDIRAQKTMDFILANAKIEK
jgi:trigger factor